jgi:hypothetical protein
MMLRTAIANIHNDRQWWRKVLIGGALSLTIFGYPWAAGLVVESLDNTQKGFPTPLPPWREWFARYIAGLFAVLIDFVFFVLPVIAVGLVLFCVAVALLLADGPSSWLAAAGVLGLLYEVAMFAIGVSPVGRLIYVENGHAEDALGIRPLRQALRPGARRIYARARLLSLPAYLPAVLLAVLLWLVGGSGLPGTQLLVLLLLWLAASALLYAHLVVAQLYAIAERFARYA